MFTIHVNFNPVSVSVSALLRGARQGQTLLEFLLEKNITIRHDCGGMCSCSTCHILVNRGEEHLEEKSVREQHFLQRLPDKEEISRLACQCVLATLSGELEITLPAEV